jgi:hypothetical protein
MSYLFPYGLAITGCSKQTDRPIYLYRPVVKAGDKASPHNPHFDQPFSDFQTNSTRLAIQQHDTGQAPRHANNLIFALTFGVLDRLSNKTIPLSIRGVDRLTTGE